MGKRLQTHAAVTCMKTLLMGFNVIFWISGLVILLAGVFLELEVYKYVEISPDLSGTAPWILVATGGFMLLLGALACCCTAKGQPVLLFCYAAFLLVIFVILVGAGVSAWAYRDRMKAGYEDGLTSTFTQYGKNETFTNAVNNIQSTLSCCGIHNASDWVSMPYGQTHDPPYPPTCCRDAVDNQCLVYPQGGWVTLKGYIDSKILQVCPSCITFLQ
ncbi:unnamed protein product, partial [Meganyctiphanes norvegica]